MEDSNTDDEGVTEKTCEVNFHHYTLFDVTTDPGLKDSDGKELPRPFTKNQMRKWLKKVRWEKNKVLKRAKERARAKTRIHEKRAANLDLGISRKTLKKQQEEKPKRNMGVILDLSFDDLMIEKDLCKMIKQILRCYSVNRRSEQPLQFHITSFGKKSKQIISRHNGYENWDGLCLKVAEEQGIRHAQLPLGKYINMKTRKVLTIDHVFEIVLRVAEKMPWQEVLMKVLPERKGAKVNDDASSSSLDMSYQSDVTT
ncbi:tRNA methyltransferase 10 homolog A isoform X2 [Epargyreus clarus]|uniref:tRNA methyltransferase 10 homolog A isoform X2 n=1 Tax=Epargyreus clarus TaxID=520877 RepID=UPI003C2D2EDC